MSAVTASIIVGSRHRMDPGIQPRWLVLLHEGQNYAWHLVRLQLTGVPGPPGLDVAPGVLWRSSGDGHLVEELALMLHLFATHTAEVTEAVRHCPSLKRARVDLDSLEGRERGDYENAMRLAAEHGRELLLAATIHRDSRLTEDALRSMPDWELDVAHTALTRHWTALHGFSITDYRQLGGEGVDHEVSYEDWIDGAHDPLDGPEESRDTDHDTPGDPDRADDPRDHEVAGPGPTHLELSGGRLRPARRGWMRRAARDDAAEATAGGASVGRDNAPVVGRPVREKVGLAEFFGFTEAANGGELASRSEHDRES
ncbi:hypothetical protein [Agilicoccus flavus]|uniref:hypothetical protein n=1 Tax=Agilicoccus flavus TaxID=2775968 RepID=UPI001CF64B05|nr:hypothetical protein [Agilicoccus flavus]